MRDTLGSFVSAAAAALARAGVDEPRRRARSLVAGVMGLSPTELLGCQGHRLQCNDADRLHLALGRLLRGEPVSRILGRREFWGLDFSLSADTLDPRPESETVVEAVLARVADRHAPWRILDLGTGTGCLLLALLSEWPAASGVGVDMAAGAVRTARANAVALGLADRARFLVADWGAAMSGQFAAVVANPPYVATDMLADLPPAVRRYDPMHALDGGAEGLAAYRRIAPELPALLAPGGIVAVEVGAGQAAAVAAIFEDRGMVIDATERDLAEIERCVVARTTGKIGR